ncbi:hypothetical protein CYMTET_23917 [Cymbomonas tetramitiformis]|uniref:Uncharacterized protein n=1 Tax=Cymbomonas tetramitiformis TaxID=36881 RepID=A0AAE0FWU8_9CHLO|nr:hypothetical protein CYMTET_23917 [Cymbomonas tetramitiformis]
MQAGEGGLGSPQWLYRNANVTNIELEGGDELWGQALTSFLLREDILAMVAAQMCLLLEQIAGAMGASGTPGLFWVYLLIFGVVLLNSVSYVILIHVLYFMLLRTIAVPVGGAAAEEAIAKPTCRYRRWCGVPPFGFGKPAIGALAVLSLFCISFAGVAVSASTASAVSAYASATEVPSPGGDLDWETPSFYFTNDFVDSVNPAQGFLLAHDVPPLQPPEPPDTVSLLAFQDLSQADLGIGMAYYYGMALHESGPLDVEHYYGAGFFTSYYGMDLREATADYYDAVD